MAPTAPLDLRALRSACTGPVAAPGDASWDGARQAWNLAVDQQPAVVVHATGPQDVASAIEFARRSGLRVAPQGTGHGASTMPDLGDALLLKTSLMDEITIDPVARRARVGAGVLWGDVATQAGVHGLAALHGSSIDVGVTGYTLGGGIGWLARKHGFASNSVTAVELVTADGRERRVEGDDGLFWALRGGGDGLGVVTAIEFTLFPLTELYAGSLFWPGEAAHEVLHAYRAWAPTVPEELTSIVRLLHLPPLPDVPAPLRDVPVIDIGLAFLGDAAEGEELIRPLREAVTPMIDTLGMIPAPQLMKLHGDPEQPVPGLGHHTVLRELTPAGIEALVEVAGPESQSPLLGVELRHLGGALARREPGHGALAVLDGDYLLYAVGIPVNPEVGRAVQERLDAVVDAVSPWSTGGTYLNFADQPGSASNTAFDPETYTRLQAIKAAVDPDGLLLANHPVLSPV